MKYLCSTRVNLWLNVSLDAQNIKLKSYLYTKTRVGTVKIMQR